MMKQDRILCNYSTETTYHFLDITQRYKGWTEQPDRSLLSTFVDVSLFVEDNI